MFYHDLGVILYYSRIRDLQDKVILSPRWFVESLGKVLSLQGRETYQTREMWRILRENGILIQPLYVAVWRECEDIDPEGMMELLVCFHLAALVKTEVYHDLNAPQYFVPSVLPLFRGDRASPVNAIVRATPLHITFSTKFVPPGYFTRFVTTMASFMACQLNFENGIYRNLVSFKFGDGRKYDDIIFIELPYAIQVDISRNVPDSHEYTSFNKTCQDLLVVLDESCKEVDRCFHQSSPSNSIHRKFQFLCKSDECGPAAVVHYLKDTDEIQTQIVPCSCEGKKKQGMFRKLTEEEAYWFPALPQGAKTKRISQQEMLQISREIGGSGEHLATQLGRLTKWQQILHDPTAVNKVVHLLYEWDKGGGEREELVHHLKELQFSQLAEKLADNDTNSSNIRSHSDDKLKSLLRRRHVTSKPTPDNQSNLDSSEPPVDLPPDPPVSTPSVPNPSNLDPSEPVDLPLVPPVSIPSVSNPVEPPIPQLLLCETDMIRCCRFIDDIELLAGIIGLTDDELAKIQQNYRRKEICALRLIEKWMQKNPQKSKDDLYELLLAANQRRAARSLKDSKSCILL